MVLASVIESWATVELTHGGGFRVLGAVFDLGPHCSVALMGERAGRTAIVGRTGAEAAPEQVGAAMAEWVQGGGLARVPVTERDRERATVDAACRQLLGRLVRLTGRQRDVRRIGYVSSASRAGS